MQLWGCSICKAYDFCWGCGSIVPLPALLFSPPFRWGRRREKRGKCKELLITCFVWSESPCKYMNSKCGKSNLVVHRYIVPFAYLPAPVFSCRILGLGIWNMQRYAYISPPFFTLHHSFSAGHPLWSPQPCTSFCMSFTFQLFPSLPHPFPTTPWFSSHWVSLRHQGAVSPLLTGFMTR